MHIFQSVTKPFFKTPIFGVLLTYYRRLLKIFLYEKKKQLRKKWPVRTLHSICNIPFLNVDIKVKIILVQFHNFLKQSCNDKQEGTRSIENRNLEDKNIILALTNLISEQK